MEKDEVCSYEELLRQADGFIAPSSFVRDGLVQIGVEAARIQVVPYGGVPNDPRLLDDDNFPGSSSWSAPASSEPLRLLWVGSIVYRKGAHHLAEVIRHLPFPVKLTVVARSGRSQNPFSGLQGVTFRRNLSPSELAEIYASHDILCFPSLAEGFGLTVAEALGAGLPVLATSATGARDIVAPGVNGIVLDSARLPGVLTEAISRLHHDRSQLLQLHEGARRLAADRAWSSFRERVIEAIGALEETHQELGSTPRGAVRGEP